MLRMEKTIMVDVGPSLSSDRAQPDCGNVGQRDCSGWIFVDESMFTDALIVPVHKSRATFKASWVAEQTPDISFCRNGTEKMSSQAVCLAEVLCHVTCPTAVINDSVLLSPVSSEAKTVTKPLVDCNDDVPCVFSPQVACNTEDDQRPSLVVVVVAETKSPCVLLETACVRTCTTTPQATDIASATATATPRPDGLYEPGANQEIAEPFCEAKVVLDECHAIRSNDMSSETKPTATTVDIAEGTDQESFSPPRTTFLGIVEEECILHALISSTKNRKWKSFVFIEQVINVCGLR